MPMTGRGFENFGGFSNPPIPPPCIRHNLTTTICFYKCKTKPDYTKHAAIFPTVIAVITSILVHGTVPDALELAYVTPALKRLHMGKKRNVTRPL